MLPPTFITDPDSTTHFPASLTLATICHNTQLSISLGKDFGERFSASLNAINVANRRVELDNSVTFGGFHWNNPREIYVELRYRFHY